VLSTKAGSNEKEKVQMKEGSSQLITLHYEQESRRESPLTTKGGSHLPSNQSLELRLFDPPTSPSIFALPPSLKHLDQAFISPRIIFECLAKLLTVLDLALIDAFDNGGIERAEMSELGVYDGSR
jgi:hypothetical protein